MSCELFTCSHKNTTWLECIHMLPQRQLGVVSLPTIFHSFKKWPLIYGTMRCWRSNKILPIALSRKEGLSPHSRTSFSQDHWFTLSWLWRYVQKSSWLPQVGCHGYCWQRWSLNRKNQNSRVSRTFSFLGIIELDSKDTTMVVPQVMARILLTRSMTLQRPPISLVLPKGSRAFSQYYGLPFMYHMKKVHCMCSSVCLY